MPDTTPAGGQGFPAENRDGSPTLIGKDDYTKWEATNRINKGNVTVLTGNFADLQRVGAEAAVGKAISGVETNPTVDPSAKNVVTPAQADAARGEYTVESERAGLVSAPPAPEPTVDTTPNPVDPTSQSPTTVKSAPTATKEK